VQTQQKTRQTRTLSAPQGKTNTGVDVTTYGIPPLGAMMRGHLVHKNKRTISEHTSVQYQTC
jgi:hypothetical protein